MNLFSHRMAPVAAICLFAAAPAWAQNNVTLQNLSIRNGEAKTTLTIARVDVANTNLSRDEVARLFSGEAGQAELLSIGARMKADRLTIAGASIADDEARIELEPFEATGIDKGRFRKARLGGFKGTFADVKKGGGGSLTARSLELEDGNFGPLLAAAQAKNFDAAGFQIGRVTWGGFEGSFTDTDVSAAAAGGNQVKVSLKSLTASTEYSGDTPLRSKGEALGLVIEPPPASEFGKGLRSFGYEKLEIGFSGAGRYDPAARTLAVEDYTLTGVNAGRLSLSGDLSGIDPSVLTATDANARAMALLAASVGSLRIAFVNEGLVEKSFAYAAAQQGKNPAALRSEVSSMAVQLLPLLLGGDPSSLALAQSAQSFLANPRSFTLSLKARGAPVPLARLGAIKDPSTFLALVEVNLTANQ